MRCARLDFADPDHPVSLAEVEYAGGIDAGDEVVLLTAGDHVWLTVDGSVRGSAVVR